MTDYAEPRRFELACHAYEQGIELIRANLSEEELAKVCLSMVIFTDKQTIRFGGSSLSRKFRHLPATCSY